MQRPPFMEIGRLRQSRRFRRSPEGCLPKMVHRHRQGHDVIIMPAGERRLAAIIVHHEAPEFIDQMRIMEIERRIAINGAAQ